MEYVNPKNNVHHTIKNHVKASELPSNNPTEEFIKIHTKRDTDEEQLKHF